MSTLKYSDAFCCICRGVLIEPVTLPCFHVFCLNCLERSLPETSYSCPLCRQRVSNWVRGIRKRKTLVDLELWSKIKDQYQELVELKLNGEDDGLDERVQEENRAAVPVSKPGQLAQEFSNLCNEYKNELEKRKATEELATKAFILKLKEEEDIQIQLAQENNARRIQEDAILARKIQEEINKDVRTANISEPCGNSSGSSNKSSTRRSGSLRGPMDDYVTVSLSPQNVKENDASLVKEPEERSRSTDSTDSIRMETNLFKPIKKVRKTPPKQYPDGRVREINVTKVVPLKLSFDNSGPSSSSGSIVEHRKIHSTCSAFADTNKLLQELKEEYASPSKRLRYSLDNPESTVLKDITSDGNADLNLLLIAHNEINKKNSAAVKNTSQLPTFDEQSTEKDSKNSEALVWKIIEEQQKMEKILLQEKQDRELALKLSREWEWETLAVNRCQTRSMRTTDKSTKPGNKLQQTLLETMSGSTRSRKK